MLTPAYERLIPTKLAVKKKAFEGFFTRLEKGVVMQDIKEIPTSRSRGRAHRYQTVAKILDVSVRHVIREVERGKLKVTFIGPRQPRIFDDELDRYVAAGAGDEQQP